MMQNIKIEDTKFFAKDKENALMLAKNGPNPDSIPLQSIQISNKMSKNSSNS